MPHPPQQLLADMKTRLQAIHERQETYTPAAILQSIDVVHEHRHQLTAMFTSNPPQSEQEEIAFFKTVRPEFDGRLLYFLQLLRILQFLPNNKPEKAAFYTEQYHGLQAYYQQYPEFYRYCRLDQTYLDRYYFLRQQQPLSVPQEDGLFCDRQLYAPMSAVLARFSAGRFLESYLDHQLWVLESGQPQAEGGSMAAPGRGLTWTASKAALVELIYALQEHGCFGHTPEVKKVAVYISTVFGIRLGNIYKVYEDIRLRKKSRTPFLDGLQRALLRRMEQDDEFAL